MDSKPVADVRSNFSRVCNEAELLRNMTIVTSRGSHKAAVVPVELAEAAAAVGGADAAAAVLRRYHDETKPRGRRR